MAVPDYSGGFYSLTASILFCFGLRFLYGLPVILVFEFQTEWQSLAKNRERRVEENRKGFCPPAGHKISS